TRPSFADIDDSRVLARSLQHALAAGRQAFQMNTRRLVGAVLTPHHAEDSELGKGGFTPKQGFDALEFLRRDSVATQYFGSNCRDRRGGHVGKLYCRISRHCSKSRKTA